MIGGIEQQLTITLKMNGEETKIDTYMRQELWMALEAIKL